MGLQLSKKIFATLMSAVLVLALVPAFACAQFQSAFADETSAPGPAIKNTDGCVLPSSLTMRSSVEKITFTNEIPQDPSITPEDVSEDGDGSVVAWAMRLDSGRYEVFYASDGKYPSFPAKSEMFFKNFTYLENIDGLENVSTANVTDMSEMFINCTLLTSLDLSSFDTTKVTSMRSMFENCQELESLNTSNFDTSKVTTFSRMFYKCSVLKVLDLSNFKTESATDMSNMFSRCKGLKELNVSSFDTSKVTNMSEMFNDCNKLRQLNISNFNTSQVSEMMYMFCGLSSIKQLDLSNFDTSKITNMSSMFADCENLRKLDLSSFDTSNVTDMTAMFAYCNLLESLDLSSFDTSKVELMEGMFAYCFDLKTLNLNSFAGDNLEATSGMFAYCNSLESVDLSHLNTPVLSSTESMFAHCTKLKSINLASFDAKSIANCDEMFSYCVNLENVYASDKFKLSSTATSEEMFYEADKLIGENGTTYDPDYEDGTYARVDVGDDAPGYFKLAKVTSAKLSANSFEYDGKIKTPKVVAKCGDFVLDEDIDYTVAYPAKAKKIGKYSLTVNGAGSYSSTVAPVKANFKIIPRSCKLKSVKASTKALKVKWKKKAKAHPSGYQIKIATNKKFTTGKKSVKVKNYKISSKKITKLKKNKKYFVKLRVYKKVDGKTYYSAWSKVKTKKTK